MPSTFKNAFCAGLLAAFLLGLWLERLWQPENQVRLHSEHLVRQIEKRDWSAAGNFVAPDYHDDWGDDRARLLARLRMVLRFFSSLTIIARDAQTNVDKQEAIWRARIRIAGGGGEMTANVVSRANGLTEPFALYWRRTSRWPWDWKLERVSNSSLEISGDFY